MDKSISEANKVETINPYKVEFRNPIEIFSGEELTIIKYSPNEPG